MGKRPSRILDHLFHNYGYRKPHGEGTPTVFGRSGLNRCGHLSLKEIDLGLRVYIKINFGKSPVKAIVSATITANLQKQKPCTIGRE